MSLFQFKTISFKGLLTLLFLATSTITYSQIYDWAFNPAGTGNDRANAIKCDASGNSYVVGQFFGTIDIDPGIGVTNLTSTGDRDFYVAKYDVSKNFVWGFKIGGTTADIANGVTLDASGNVFVVGVFGNTVDFDPGAGTSNLVANGFALNAFVAKYSNAGAFMAAYNVGFGGTASSGSLAKDISIDNSGNFFVTGTFYGTVDLNSGAAVNNVTATGSNAYFVSKFNSAGTFLFGFKLDYTGGSGQGLAMAVLPAGDFYLTGVFGGTTDFDPSASVFNLTALGTDDAFLVKYTSAGSFSWAFKLGAGGLDCSKAITTDAAGNAYITGEFIGSVDFDPGAGIFSLTSQQEDVFVAKYTSSGAFSWAFKIGGALSNESGTALTMDSNNDLYVAGYFLSANVDFDPGPGVVTHSASSAIDVFAAKYSSLGNYIWSFSLADNAGSQPVSLAVNNLALYMAGFFTGGSATIDCDPSAATANLIQVGGEDGLVAKYNHCSSPSILSSPTSTSICASSNTSFTTSATGSGLTYQWQVNQGAGFSNISNGGVYSGATTPTLVLTGPSTGMNNWSYQCVVSGLCSPTATSTSATLTVLSAPPAPGAISGNVTTCSGASIVYSVTSVPGATSYSWTLPSGWSGTSFANMTFATTNTNSGIVSVSASNSCGTSSTTTLSVSATSIPSQPSSILGNVTVCDNTVQQYSIAAVAGATSYSWNITGGLSGSSITNTISVSVNTITSGSLTVVASNSCGASPSQSLIVNINPSPTITVNSGSICAGQSFTISPSGASTYTFSGGSAIVSPTANTSYSISGTSSVGCVSLLFATSNITVSSTPTILVNSGAICNGQSFTISPTGASTYTFSGGSAIVSPTANTSYSISGTSSVGCVSVLPTISTVTVNSLPTINVTTSNSVLCVGQTATLNTGGANTYTWNTSAITSSIVISPTLNTTYTVAGTDSNGCVDSVSFVQIVSACTGVENILASNNINVFPNPFLNTITLVLTEKHFSHFEIYNVIGELVYNSESLNEETITVDLSQHNPGIYFIRLHNKDGQVVNKKIIKQ
ncbi:MAG: T9SS type A sorting domain-containing protein [Sphingobacteriaceae bacterium]|nr:T9SS type A sorting domain-containing protein [Sphingobacteriaceae bacterium]